MRRVLVILVISVLTAFVFANTALAELGGIIGMSVTTTSRGR
ncbi:MAG TPA: hypothetical protein VGK74_17010 [Symbiobacteriaceae bacterium]